MEAEKNTKELWGTAVLFVIGCSLLGECLGILVRDGNHICNVYALIGLAIALIVVAIVRYVRTCREEM